MTEEIITTNEQAPERRPEAALPAKKAYEKPAVIYRGPVEAMAAQCGRQPGTAKNSAVDCFNLPHKS